MSVSYPFAASCRFTCVWEVSTYTCGIQAKTLLTLFFPKVSFQPGLWAGFHHQAPGDHIRYL